MKTETTQPGVRTMKDELTMIDAVSIERTKAGFAIRIEGKAARNLERLVNAINTKLKQAEEAPEEVEVPFFGVSSFDTAEEYLSQYFIDDLSKLTDTELFADKVCDIAELRGMSDEALTDILDAVGSIETDTDD